MIFLLLFLTLGASIWGIRVSRQHRNQRALQRNRFQVSYNANELTLPIYPLQMVVAAPGIQVPAAVAEFWEDFAPALIPYVGFKLYQADELQLSDSKLLGYPMLPLDFPYPLDDEGQPMALLAQINCSELPPLDPFPPSGYLQFYLKRDDIYGIDFDNLTNQKGFRVLYFTEEQVKKHQTDFSFLPANLSEETPVDRTQRMEFYQGQEFYAYNDVRNEALLAPAWAKVEAKYPTLFQAVQSMIEQTDLAPKHRLGGYAYFTQDDPRYDKKEWLDSMLLFQLDSDKNVLWGDVGVGNFFIKPEDLKHLHFDNVLYSWDCS